MRYCRECDGAREASLEVCPRCGTALERRATARARLATLLARPPDWEPRAPRLSVSASILLLWAALHTLGAFPVNGLGFLGFGVAGLLIVPRVRLAIGRLGGGSIEGPTAGDWLLTGVVVVSTAVLYLLLSTAAWVVLGLPLEGAVVPGSPIAPVQALVAGVVVVGAGRFVRELLGASPEGAGPA